MKKFITPIFLFVIMCGSFFNNFSFNNCYAINERQIVFIYDGYELGLCEDDIISNSPFLEKFTSREMLKRLHNMGFSPYQCLLYVYPEIDNAIYDICKKFNTDPINSSIVVDSGNAIATVDQVGRRVDVEQIYLDLFYSCLENSGDIVVNINIEDIFPVVTKERNLELTNLKSTFVTYINGINQEGRIHNISRALSMFNGLEIKSGEVISFNEIVGDTTKENGYELAKVIINGKYTEDFGGGVCQAATTLYNAALIAGLSVESVSPHSLKVGYVLGSFDAMVSNYSDLKIRNPYDNSVFIYTYATDFECGVKIFGEVNEFRIERRNEKLEFDEEEFPNVNYKSEGYLDYFIGDELIKSEKIRKDTYFKIKTEETSSV